MDSILTSVKKQLGIIESCTDFDDIIVININTAFSSLRQLGVGPSKGFSISDSTATWDDFIGEDDIDESVKTFVFLKVKLLFDPPGTSFVLESYNKVLEELEWRLNFAVESDQL